MKTADFLIIVDHKWRDLPGLAALAVNLQQKHGLMAELASYSEWRWAVLTCRPKAIIVSILYGERSREIVRYCRKFGIKVIVVMTEGRPNNDQTMEYCVGRDSGANEADLFFAWSHTVKDYMVAQGVLPESKVFVAGSLRFDFYRDPLNKLIQPRETFLVKYGLDPRQPVITWATNFTHAKFYKKNEDFLIKNWTELGLIKFPAYADPLEVAYQDFEVRKQTAQVLKGLLSARTKLQLLVKPHPSEDHGFYEDFVRECCREFGPRIAFIGNEYIWDVLNVSQAHIHRLCTTGVEAWFLNVPSVELHLKNYGPWSTELSGSATDAMQGNDYVSDLESLCERVDYYLKGGKVSDDKCKARDIYVKRWLDRIDGKRMDDHSRRLADVIREGPGMPHGQRWDSQTTRFMGKAFLKHVHSLVLGKKKTDYIGHVDKNVDNTDVEIWKNKIFGIL